nr:WecB/TagA/CpsF family glycosyltransferase [Coleofasciculus chthonoplastes]
MPIPLASEDNGLSVRQKVKILNLYIDNFYKDEFLKKLKQGIVFTPNVDHLMQLQSNRQLLQAYKAADYVICDSQILVYASKFLGTPFKEKLAGSDVFPAFCHYHKDNPDIRVFLLGAAPGVAKKAQERINARIGRKIVVGEYSPPWGFENDEQECHKIVQLINESNATVLGVGVGAPKQELFISKYKHKFNPNIKIIMGIGATIDFEAGNVKRAPKFLSDIGLEWFYRFSVEPRRLWKRYFVDDVGFLWLILKQKLKLYKAPF